MLCDALISLLFIVFPLRYFFPVDPETDAAPVIDYIGDDTSSLSAKLPGKQTPLEHSDIAHFLSLSCMH